MRARILAGFICGVFTLAAAACSDDDCDCTNANPKTDGPVVKKDSGVPPKDGPVVKKEGGGPQEDGPVVKKDSGPPPPPVKIPDRILYASAYNKAGTKLAKWTAFSAKTKDGTDVKTLVALSAAAQKPSHLSLSPDGNFLAFNLAKALAVADFKTKKVKANVRAYNAQGWAKGWAWDEGKLIVRYQGIRVLDMPDGAVFSEQVETTKTSDDRAAISADNKKIAYVGKDNKGNATLIVKDSALKKELAAGAVGLKNAGWVFWTKAGFMVVSDKGWHTFDASGKQKGTVDLPPDPAPVATEALWPRPNQDGTYVIAWVKPKTPADPKKPFQIRRYAADGKTFHKVADVAYTVATSDYCVSKEADVVYVMEDGYKPMLYTSDSRKISLPKTQFRYAKCLGLK